ncbi:hypothetical protein Tco_0504851 [Tanacetum coccineum]
MVIETLSGVGVIGYAIPNDILVGRYDPHLRSLSQGSLCVFHFRHFGSRSALGESASQPYVGHESLISAELRDPDLSKDDSKHMMFYEEYIQERLRHRDQMRRWESYVNGRPLRKDGNSKNNQPLGEIVRIKKC